MPNHPLLVFPRRSKSDRAKRHGGPGHLHYPNKSRQLERLKPQFAELEKAFENRAIEIKNSSAGILPEQVLVIEVIGSVEDFINAVSKVDGLEWLCEFELDELEPDSDFYDTSSKEKSLSGLLFMVMTNDKALKQMLSLWKIWQKIGDDPEAKMPYGLTKFRDVFSQLKEIRVWSTQDRLLETKILEYWNEDLKHEGNEPRRFEIELWFRQSEDERQKHQKEVERLIELAGGTIHSSYINTEIAYHSILAELPMSEIKKIIESKEIELIKCESVFLFWPHGQAVEDENFHTLEETDITPESKSLPLPQGDPVIAVLDGFPMQNHERLKGRIIVDDPDEWGVDYPVVKRVHGTAMLSLTANGDMLLSQPPQTRPVYTRPIMRPNLNASNGREELPNDTLFVDTIHRAVRRMFEQDGVESPQAPSVKIINLSIGDEYRPFARKISPLARLLDWLSYKYNVLFIVSAGNYETVIHLNGDTDVAALSADERTHKIIEYLYSQLPHRRILSPGESINALTIGACHFDNSGTKIGPTYNVDPFENKVLPSIVSPFGSGYRNSVKPDGLHHGGKQLVTQLAKNQPITGVATSLQPGILVATPDSNELINNKMKYSIGTSNASALTSYAAGKCYDVLADLMHKAVAYDDSYSVVLLKALLSHSFSWSDDVTSLESVFEEKHAGKLKELIRRWFGYGIFDLTRVLNCTDERVTVMGYGELSGNEADLFEFPLPPTLESNKHFRRMIATLAWLSPVSPKTYKYRDARLWLKMPELHLFDSTSEVSINAASRGTLQHVIYESKKAVSFKGQNSIPITVNCSDDAGKIVEPIRYGIVVTLEVDEGMEIYQQIRTALQAQIGVKQKI